MLESVGDRDIRETCPGESVYSCRGGAIVEYMAVPIAGTPFDPDQAWEGHFFRVDVAPDITRLPRGWSVFFGNFSCREVWSTPEKAALSRIAWHEAELARLRHGIAIGWWADRPPEEKAIEWSFGPLIHGPVRTMAR